MWSCYARWREAYACPWSPRAASASGLTASRRFARARTPYSRRRCSTTATTPSTASKRISPCTGSGCGDDRPQHRPDAGPRGPATTGPGPGAGRRRPLGPARAVRRGRGGGGRRPRRRARQGLERGANPRDGAPGTVPRRRWHSRPRHGARLARYRRDTSRGRHRGEPGFLRRPPTRPRDRGGGRRPRPGPRGGRGVWPTVVCDEWGHTLGLVWSTRESLARAIAERRGIYWSRSRQALWEKGATSGNTQELVRVDLDCDRDALRFTVRQRGAGFCHLDRPACWPSRFDLDDLARTITERAARPEPGSGTAKLLADPTLLAAKLVEEAEELGRAEAGADVVRETADVLYLSLVAVVRGGGTLAEAVAELARRRGAVTRRPMAAKAPAEAP